MRHASGQKRSLQPIHRPLVLTQSSAGIKGRVAEVQSSNQYSKEGPSRNVRSAATIGGSAGLGAILGGILGGGKGAAIGAMIGAGAGTGVQAAGRAAVVQLPAESTLSFRLQAALTVTPASTLQRGKNVDPDSSSSDSFSDDDRPVLKRRPGSAPPETTSVGRPTANSN